MKTPPDKIWLQLYGEGEPQPDDTEISMENVCWHHEQIFKHDVEYVRSDARADLEGEIKALLELLVRVRSKHSPPAVAGCWCEECTLNRDIDKALAKREGKDKDL